MAYDFFHRSEAQDAVLDALLAASSRAGAAGGVALDLDGCLFDNRGRQLRIARAWADATGDTRLAGLRLRHFEDWSFSRTLRNLGLPAEEAATLSAEFRPFWERWFFADAYVIHDLPLPGAARFARAIAASGTRVVYLTGRVVAQRPNTLATLRRYGFPIDADGEDLWAKPTDDQTDVSWKRIGLDRLAEERELLAFVDNEPIHIVESAANHPNALSVWVDTDHSPRPIRVAEGTPTLRGFLRTTDWVPPGA